MTNEQIWVQVKDHRITYPTDIFEVMYKGEMIRGIFVNNTNSSNHYKDNLWKFEQFSPVHEQMKRELRGEYISEVVFKQFTIEVKKQFADYIKENYGKLNIQYINEKGKVVPNFHLLTNSNDEAAKMIAEYDRLYKIFYN